MASLHVASELVKAVANIMYPVGSIYISLTTTNPGTFLGGTWEQCGKGRFPVSYDPNNAKFNSMGKTGGNATHTHTTGDHTLTIQEIPEHSHEIPDRYIAWDFDGNGTNAASGNYGATPIQFHAWGTRTFNAGNNWAHNHGNTGSAGTLPPYFVCCMWKRTA